MSSRFAMASEAPLVATLDNERIEAVIQPEVVILTDRAQEPPATIELPHDDSLLLAATILGASKAKR